MNRIGRIVIALLVAASASVHGQTASGKVAVVDASRVLKAFNKTKQADARMEEQVAEFRAEGDRMIAERDKLKAEFETARTEAQSKALSEKAQGERKDLAEDKLLKMMEYESKIRDTAASRRKQLEEQRFRMHQRLVDEIAEGIGKYAEKEGYAMVLDSSGLTTSGFKGVIYSSSNMDITTTMINLLNKSEPAAAPAK